LHSLHWISTVIDSDPKFTEAYINVIDDKIIFRSPFNKKFVEKINKEVYKFFSWEKEKKVYVSNFSTHALKFIVDLSQNFYSRVNYCEATESIINKLQENNARYWSPTLVMCNNQLMVAAINSHLYEHIKDIDLSLDPDVLSKLATFGIKIDDKLIDNDPLLHFASNYIVEVDYKDLTNIIEYLKAIQTDIVFVSGSVVSQHNIKKILMNKISMASIKVDDKPKVLLEERINDTTNPVIITFSSSVTHIPSVFNKIIIMKNSTPVIVK
jgi:hypothetical protein